MAIVPRTGEIVLLQMDGDLSPDEFEQAMELSIGAAKQIYEIQRDALRRWYAPSAEAALAAAAIAAEAPPPPPAEMPPPPPENEDVMREVDDL